MTDSRGGPAESKPPRVNVALLAAEARAPFEAAALVPSLPFLLRSAPRGDGHDVVVIPPFGVGDVFTATLRLYLERLGYHCHRWRLREILAIHRLSTAAMERLAQISKRGSGKLTLVGHSLGGIYAREIARHAPELVRSVITVGSPFAGDLKSNFVWPMYEAVTGTRIANLPPDFLAHMNENPPVPTTAIYSRSDGVASWQSCIEPTGPQAENIEVQGSHIGLLHNPMVLYVIADRLAQPLDDWKPFARDGWRAAVYRT